MDRLIESRLTPNKISMTGLVLNVAAAVLVTQELWVLAGVAFIVGSIMDTLDGRFARSSGKGTPFGAFLDSTLDRVEEGIVLAAVAAYFATQDDEVAVAATVAVVLFSLMVSYTRARAEALGVENKGGHRHPPGAGRHPLDRPRVRKRGWFGYSRLTRARDLRDGGLDPLHHAPAHLARAQGAHGFGRLAAILRPGVTDAPQPALI